ncbi:MAG: substrate-binding domain-containing protein [Victivallales bacterium]
MVEIDLPRKSRIVKKYPRVLNALRLKIGQGHFDGMLPGVQKLAQDFDVNFMTVNKAINMLVRENLLYRIPRKGTFVRRTYRIALVFLHPKEARKGRMPDVYDNLIHGVEEALNARNATMVFKNIDPGTGLPGLTRLVREVDGAILLGKIKNQRINEILDSFPAIRVMGMIDEKEKLDHVTYSNHSIGRLAAEYLIRRGCGKCAFICDSNDNPLYLGRGEAFRETLEKAGENVRMIIPEIPTDADMGMKARVITSQLDRILSKGPRPDGLFIPAAWMSGIIYSFLFSRGVVPGKDVQIVICDREIMQLSGLTPQPAYVDIHSDLVGKKAVEILTRRIETPDKKREKILLEPSLVEN